MASDGFIKELLNFCSFAWPLVLSIFIWIIVNFSPNPPQRRLDDEIHNNKVVESSELKLASKKPVVPSTFKSIDDSFFPQSHAFFLPDSRFRFKRKKYGKGRRWSSSISLASESTDQYFRRSSSAFDNNKQLIFSSLCDDSGHVSLHDSIESLPNNYSTTLDKEFIEIQKFVNELNKNLKDLSPGI